jgi:hypothetical protein
MSRVLKILCSRFSSRAAALALITIGVTACSADTSRPNSSPPEATRSISETQTTQAPQPHRRSRLRRHSTQASTSPTTTRAAAAPQITGSIVRKSTSSANRSLNGGTAVTVAAGETVDSIARLAEAASTEPHRRAAGDFAARWPDRSKTPNLEAREPAMINKSHAEEHEPMDAQEEMPLIWPVLTEAERAGLPESARESVLTPAFLAGTLAMVLLFAVAILTLIRRRTLRTSSGASHAQV